ncbi:glycosyl hydrolase family 18 protein [Kitasatospora sp. NPDC086801]|uniref:glycosyl hydrolase family 18 protein n=1 Tax=Kitasatospora sp. NPDC086801 TaxID=3364066 RepID=UPI0038212CC4
MVAAVLAGLLGSLITLLTPAPAVALSDPQLRAVSFNMQGGNKWGEVRALMPNADVIVMQEATSTPDGAQLRQLEWASNELDPAVNDRGKSSLKYRLYKGPYHSSGTTRGVRGVLYYLKVLDRKEWGNWADGDGGPEDDPDIGTKAPKSMAIWVRENLAPTTDEEDIPRLDLVTPTVDNNRWVTSRPAFGIEIGDRWYFDIHAASMRVGEAVNPHTRALVNAVRAKKQGKSWQIMGDFNSVPNTLAPLPGQGEPYNTFYATRNQVPYGPPAPTQLNAGALDYLVAHDQLRNLRVSVKRGTGSDHLPVRFEPDGGPRCDVNDWTNSTVYNPERRTARAAAAGGCEDSNSGAVVAMGDSYISGEGGRWAGNALTKQEGDVWGTDRRSRCQPGQDCVYDTTSYDNGGNRCDRSDVAPIKGVEFEDIPVERRFNIACSGATTKNILSDSFKGEKPQVQQLADLARTNDIRMVVVSIGGNDLSFSEIMTACGVAFFSTALNSSCKPDGERRIASRLDSVRSDVTNTLTAIRHAMSAAGQSDYKLVLQSYPNPLPATDDFRYTQGTTISDRYRKGGCPFRDVDAEWARNSVVPRITDMLRQAAGSAGAKFLNVQDAFAGHELCAKTAEQATDANSNAAPLPASKAEWVRWVPYVPGFDPVSPNAQGDVQEAIHPNAFGQQALSQCLTEFGKAASDSDRYIFNCAGSNDGMKVAPDPSAVREGIIRLRNVRTGEVLDAEGNGSDDYLVTRPDDGRASQRWLLHNVGSKVSLQAQHNGRYLGVWNNALSGRDWAYLGGSELGWRLSPFGEGRVSLWQEGMGFKGSGACLRQDPGRRSSDTNWVGVDSCDGTEGKSDWKIEYPGDIIITPRDPASGTDPREGQQVELRSGTGMAVDLNGSSTAAGTSVQASEPKGTGAQRWVMRSLGGGNWRIAASAKPDMVVDHDPGPHTTHLVQAQEGNANQVWQPKGTGTGWYTLVSSADGGCLTAGGAGEALAVTACDANNQAQRWKFRETGTGTEVGTIRGLGGKCVEPRGGSRDDRTAVGLTDCAGSDAQAWTVSADGTLQSLAKCLDVDGGRADNGTAVQLYRCNDSPAQKWIYTARQELRNPNSGKCLNVPGSDTGRPLQISDCDRSDAQKWQLSARPVGQPDGGDAGDPFDDSADGRGTKPATSGDCRPEGMTATAGVAARYCDVYDNSGREWVGNDRTRRVVGYFTGWRAGKSGDPKYLASNIPWSKVSHVNYAFADVKDNRISIGDPNDPANPATGMTWPGDKNAMDPSLPYKGHFNLLNTYKKQHPAVKTLISVGGWAGTRNFYAMATNADGSVNQAGIDAFADSVTDFLDRYGFNGVDIDYEYPTALPSTGNPLDWDVSNPRRKGLQQGYNTLMKTLRTKLDQSGAAKGRYYLLTSAGSSSGYLVRGLDAGQALQYQDYVNVMSYDLHGSWNKYVGPQAPLYDTGQDNELAAAGIYNDQAPDTKDYQKNGYFNTDWAYHYYRGALPPGRINLGIPYYSRGWQNVQGGTDGLWGTAAMPDQAQCPLGTGGRGPANAQSCGMGAVGIDNVWHDLENEREVGAGSNPLWHTKNLQDGRTPGYLRSYGVDTGLPTGQLTGTYAEKYSDPLQASWLWNDAKKVFLSTENEKSVDAKAKYIADKGVGGAMIWELAGDYTKRSNGEWGMGYDLTTRLDNALKGAGASGNTTGGGKTLPAEVIDVKAELVDFPTDVADMWPMQPKLRITNNSKVALAQGTEISFDLPTSAPPVVKDGAWKEMSGIVPGHTGPNAGGLKGDFHRVTIKLGYCEDVPAGRSKDIDVKYYLPITGPANVTFRIGGKDYGSTGDKRRAVTTVDPPAPASGAQCQAAPWQAHAYNPNPSFAFWQTGDKWIIEDRNSGNVLDHPGSWTDAHLVDKQTGNANQLWTVTEEDAGWYHIKSGTSGHDQCLGATTARGTLTVRDCDGKTDQWWRLVPLSTDQATAGKPLLDQWVTRGPQHGSAYALGSFADGTDWWKTPAYLAAPANSATASSTKIITGDTDGAWASTVSWNGFYWRAKWWNKATDEPGKSDAWQKLGPTP